MFFWLPQWLFQDHVLHPGFLFFFLIWKVPKMFPVSWHWHIWKYDQELLSNISQSEFSRASSWIRISSWLLGSNRRCLILHLSENSTSEAGLSIIHEKIFGHLLEVESIKITDFEEIFCPVLFKLMSNLVERLSKFHILQHTVKNMSTEHDTSCLSQLFPTGFKW